MLPFNPDIMFAEARYRQEHLRAIAHQEPLFGRLRARWARRRRAEPAPTQVAVIEVPTGAPPVPDVPVPDTIGSVVPPGVPTTDTRPAVGVDIPAQRLPGQVGSPTEARGADAVEPVPDAPAVDPVRRPTPH